MSRDFKLTHASQKMQPPSRKMHVTWWLKRWSACRHSNYWRKRNTEVFCYNEEKKPTEMQHNFLVRKDLLIFKWLLVQIDIPTKFLQLQSVCKSLSLLALFFFFKKNWWHSFMAHRRCAHTKTYVILLQCSIIKFEANPIDSKTLMWNKLSEWKRRKKRAHNFLTKWFTL